MIRFGADLAKGRVASMDELGLFTQALGLTRPGLVMSRHVRRFGPIRSLAGLVEPFNR